MKNLAVFRVEYEILPNMSNWTAFVVGFSQEEIYKYLESIVGVGKIRVISSGFQCDIHGFTPEAREFLTSVGVNQDQKQQKVSEIKIGRKKRG